jgi:hypothetical protein
MRGLDLAELDPVAAALDLRVLAPGEVQDAGGVEPAEVPGPVQPARAVARVGHERRRGPLGIAPVARREARAPDADLAELAGRHRAARRRDEHALAAARPADRDRLGRVARQRADVVNVLAIVASVGP